MTDYDDLLSKLGQLEAQLVLLDVEEWGEVVGAAITTIQILLRDIATIENERDAAINGFDPSDDQQAANFMLLIKSRDDARAERDELRRKFSKMSQALASAVRGPQMTYDAREALMRLLDALTAEGGE